MAVEPEDSYRSESEYQKKQLTKIEIVEKWSARIDSARRVKQGWANRFKVDALYQYYEGFQHAYNDSIDQPYVVNMIYATIEQKLPSMLFDNPTFTLRPRPYGSEFNFDESSKRSQLKEDTLNFLCSRPEYGLSDKHELAVLDAFFGFGVLETGYSEERMVNPLLSEDDDNALNNIYCKQIPFDTFFVAPNANWDLSTGKWWGYFEWVPAENLKAYSKNLTVTLSAMEKAEGDFADSSGRINTSDGYTDEIPPPGCVKLWFIEDFVKMERIVLCLDAATGADCLLKRTPMKHSRISTLRYGKRRKGWYPLPPVFNWLSPQDEINDIRQTHRIHRKRFSRKYAILDSSIDPEELDKFQFGPDGTCFMVKRENSIRAVEDAGLDTANQVSLSVSYDDMNRVSGSSNEERGVADRQTATQSSIINNRAQIRESKVLLRVGNFLTNFGRNALRAAGEAKAAFWISSKIPEGLLGEIKDVQLTWKRVPPQIFQTEDYDLEIYVGSISPVYQQADKKTFMEFLALITQYEILAMSPALLREAAYRVGYKNSAVLKQFQELATLAALGRLNQAKAAAAPPQQMEGSQPGQLAQQQVDSSTPPDGQSIMNTIFNRQGVQAD